MKKISTLLSLLLFTISLFAQSQRVVLFEHFTQASCPPCASTNPPLFTTLGQNEGKIIPISYQVYWPGYDPMYEHNPNEVRDRVTYYGVTGVPNSVMDGNGPGSSLTLGSQSNIDTRYGVSSPFTMEVSHQISERYDEVEVTVEITATQAVSGNLVAQIAVVEHMIHFTSPPGSNGETEFHNVMKKMLPGAGGTSLPSSWAAGETQTLTYTWKMANVYDMSEIAVVAWVQNESNKEVLQAGYSEPNLTPAGPNDGLIIRSSANGDFDNPRVCGNTASPLVQLMNAGSDVLTTVDIFYSINGGAEQKHTWNGFLPYLKTTMVQLPDLGFTNQLENTLSVRVENPNGEVDSAPQNDQFDQLFKPSIQVTTTAKIEVRPLTNPGKLTWELTGSDGQVVATGGPYTTPLLPQVTDLTLDMDECYSLNFVNQANSYNGILKVFDANGVEKIKMNADALVDLNVDFGTNLALGIEDVVNTASMKVYPNPTSNELVVDFEMKETSEVQFRIANALGQTVLMQDMVLFAGQNAQTLNVADLNPGMYFLTVQTPKGAVSKTIVKE
ncbi:MAG: T9SS type A sorting domain-containing protein [Saprospiraceae bacterium]|nr:T9SS type A sorting domain-containing protein [Saprospiraceae bacterium]